MKFDKDHKDVLLSFYNSLIQKHGTKTQKSLGWYEKYAQQMRFSILSEIYDLSSKSVLDVGCGFGDFYDFLSEKYKDIKYTGIDIVPEMIKAAKEKRPGLNFIEGDFSNYDGENFDFILASGALAIKIPNYKEIYFGMIKKMFEKSNLGVGVNLLNIKYHPNNEKYCSYKVSEVYDFVSDFAEKVIVRQEYMDYDFTLFLYH